MRVWTSEEPPTVEIEDVDKTFFDHGRRTDALRGLDLTIAAGEFVSIIGPSGCGKSTLLRLIGGLIEPDQGRLAVAGRPPTEGRSAKRFGWVPQSPALLPWRTVRQNLTLLPRLNQSQGRGPVADDEVDALLDAVDLAPFASALPAELSGGMQQRVSLARAFALRPPILLMDEPFAALDEITRAGMRFLLLDLWRDTRATVVFVTHSIEEAVLLSDRVVVLTGRPGQVSDELTIDLDRPRAHGVQDAEEFHDHTVRLRASLNKAAEATHTIPGPARHPAGGGADGARSAEAEAVAQASAPAADEAGATGGGAAASGRR
ncbi:MAG: ABC transporter ATP-binding protein [Actinomycetota bacterium]